MGSGVSASSGESARESLRHRALVHETRAFVKEMKKYRAAKACGENPLVPVAPVDLFVEDAMYASTSEDFESYALISVRSDDSSSSFTTASQSGTRNRHRGHFRSGAGQQKTTNCWRRPATAR